MAEKDPATAAAEAAAKELVKVAYGDLLQPAAREIGAELGEFARAIVVAGRGFGYLIREKYEPFVLRALQSVPIERRVPPSPPLLGQILEGVSYEVEGDPIYEMFASLLKAASDIETAASVHPSYPAMIRQISGDEARLLVHLLDRDLDGETWELGNADPVFRVLPDQKLPNINLENIDFYVDHLATLGIVFSEYSNNIADRRPVLGGTACKTTVYMQPLGKRFLMTCLSRT